MCLLIAEIGMLIAGIITLIKGVVPSWALGGSSHVIRGNGARIIGLIMVLPLPVALGVGFVVGLSGNLDAIGTASLIELGTVIVAIILSIILSYFYREPANKIKPEEYDFDN
jgi:hypothetical protein